MKKIAMAGVFLAVCTLLAGCGRGASNGEYLLAHGSEIPESEDVGEGIKGSPASEEETLTVYVCGAVAAPGVYELPAGSRICDALALAGGLTGKASPDYWNLAELLTDGEMIRFPTREEAREGRGETPAASEGETDGRVNLNTATLEQLMAIPGIGQARGQAILAYRSEHGAFSSAEDIMLVSGIGNALYESMKDYIVVD